MLALKAKTNSDRQHGNGILYGGTRKMYQNPFKEVEVFFVETDFGNHMTLTWPEVIEMFEVVAVRDYDQWKEDRRQLQNEPNLIERASNFGYDDILNRMRNNI